MDILKKIFPLTWKFKGDVKNLVIAILIYFFGTFIINVILLFVPIIGWILLPVVNIYSLVGTVLSILLFANVIKDEPAEEAEAPAEEANDESAED